MGRRFAIVGLAAALGLGVLTVGRLSGPQHGDGASGVVIGLLGGKAEAAYKRMQSSVEEVQDAHLVLWGTYDESGHAIAEMRKLEELWWRPGAWRKIDSEAMGGDRLIRQEATGLRYYKYDNVSRKLLNMEELSTQPEIAFSVDSIIKSFNSGIENLVVDPTSEGPDGEQIVAHSDNGYHRFVFHLGPKTHLPVSVDMQHSVNGQFVDYMRLDTQFNFPIHGSMFSPNDLLPKP